MSGSWEATSSEHKFDDASAIRLEEELRQKQIREEDQAEREKERKRKEKLASGKAKLSFAQDEV